jgi:hypothetical protein
MKMTGELQLSKINSSVNGFVSTGIGCLFQIIVCMRIVGVNAAR